jgi:hypothetical protein
VRVFIEIMFVVLVVALAWEKSLKDRAREVSWLSQFMAAEKPKAAPTASPSGAWMWDPNRRTALDTPAPKVPLSTPGSWMFDRNHRSPLDPPRKSATPH